MSKLPNNNNNLAQKGFMLSQQKSYNRNVLLKIEECKKYSQSLDKFLVNLAGDKCVR